MGDFTFPLKTRRDFEAGEKKFISPPLKSLLVFFLLKYAYRPKLCRLSCMHALKLPQNFVFFGQKTTQKLGGWGTFHRYTHWNSDSRLFCNNGQNPCRISDRKPLKGRVTVVTYPVTTDKLWRSYSYIASCECT